MDNPPLNNTTSPHEKSIPLVAEIYNTQGICDDKNRESTFNWLKSRHHSDITILTETKCHLPNKQRDKWKKEWSPYNSKDDSFWSLGTQNSKGVTILIHEKFRKRGGKIINVLEDPNGRYIKLIIEIEEKKYRILGIYAPNNRDQIDFFTGLWNMVKHDSYDVETLMGGDYNCTLNSTLDRVNCVSNNNDKGQITLRQMIKSLNLEDIWRIRNPNCKNYTWFGPNKASRIDYWLTSASLNSQINKIESHYFPFSDHHGVKIELKTTEIKPGKGNWKMNSEHLLNEDYKREITQFWNNWKLKKNDFSDISIWWDIGKKRIKRISQNFAIEQSIKKKSKLADLESEITQLTNTMSNNTRLTELKNEHEFLLNKTTQGIKIRSRVQWWEEGEKSTRFFHSMEKQNGKNKTWDKILDSEGNLVYGTKDIQNQQVIFYKNLFTSQNINEDKSYFLSNPEKKLSDNSKQNLEREISLDEIAKAIKKMANNKSPGEDGIIIEFYKIFWNLIGEDLHEVILHGLDNEELSYSQYLALIILLYKKGPRENIKNWRPISLLNVDYKILSKVLAERLKTVLPEIIHQDQKGCVKDRQIGENIRLIEDIIHDIENTESDSVILLQDQEKAYDRVEWNWLFSTLKFFGFGNKFIGWLRTLYKNAKSSIITNGHQSAYFDITRGIRQGDSLSGLLYIIQLEPLAQKIRKDSSVKGIKLKLNNLNNYEIEVKGCQYADDCNTFLKNKNFIRNFTEILTKYEKVSGSKINVDKTKAMAVNNLAGLPTERIGGIEIITGPEKALGVPIGETAEERVKMWDNLISKVKKKLDFWRLRNLSLQGKVYIIRSIGISKLLYMLEMKTIDKNQLKYINELFWKFLWGGKNKRFSKDICYLPRSMGGLNLTNIYIIEKVKRVNWIIRFLKDDTGQPWTKLMENHLRCLDRKFSVPFFALKTTDAADLIKATGIPKFYQESLIYFQELMGISKIKLREEFIWCNNTHRFNNKPLCFPHWARDGILRPSQLYTDGILDPIRIFNQLTNRAGFFFEFRTIRKVFPQTTNNTILERESLENAGKSDLLKLLIKIPGKESKCLEKLTSKDIYNIFLHNKTPENLSKLYWSNYMFNAHEFNWETWYLYVFQNSLAPRKSVDFSWKAFYGLLETEATLKRWRKSDGNCRCCVILYENYEHLMINCQYRAKIWTLVQNLLQEALGQAICLTRLEILTGYFKNDLNKQACFVLNAILICTRYSLWLSRNLIKHENRIINFRECSLRLKHYIKTHMNILLTSNRTDSITKGIITKLSDALDTIFRNDLDESQIRDIF